jgi:hypothetical protein
MDDRPDALAGPSIFERLMAQKPREKPASFRPEMQVF